MFFQFSHRFTPEDRSFWNLRGFYLACRSILRIWTICFRDFLESRSIFSFPLEKVLAWDFWVYWSVILSRIDVLYSKQTVLSGHWTGFFCFFFCLFFVFHTYSLLFIGFSRSMYILDQGNEKTQKQWYDFYMVVWNVNTIMHEFHHSCTVRIPLRFVAAL